MMQIYVDETGVAEREGKFGLGGVIVNDSSLESLDRQTLEELVKKYGITDTHAMNINDMNFFIDFVEHTKNKKHIVPFYFGTSEREKDSGHSTELILHSKSLPSRYYEIIENFLEYIFFIDEDIADKITHINFLSRAQKVKNDEELEKYKKLGFDYYKKNKKNEEFYIIPLLTKNNVFNFIFSILNKYRSQSNRIKLKEINVMTFDYLKDNDSIYYKYADIFANLVNKIKLVKKQVDLKKWYRPFIKYNHRDFRNLSKACVAYYNKDYISFFSMLPEQENSFFQQKLKNLAIGTLRRDTEKKDDRLKYAILYLKDIIEQKRGNYNTVIELGEIIEQQKERISSPEDIRLLYSVMQRAYNHTGDYSRSRDYFNLLMTEYKKDNSFQSFYEKIESINRYAISLTNIFKFEEAKTLIDSVFLELKSFGDFLSKSNIKHSNLLGKVFGSYGQIKALMLEEDAEYYFKKAIDLFSSENQKNIQNTYLCHFYIDQNDFELSREYLEKSIGDLNNIDSNLLNLLDSNKYSVALYLKFLYYFDLYDEISEKILEDLEKKLINDKNKEHPVEKILGYIALIKTKRKLDGIGTLINVLESMYTSSGITRMMIINFFLAQIPYNKSNFLEINFKYIEENMPHDYQALFVDLDAYFADLKNLKYEHLKNKFLEKFTFYFK